MSNVLRFKPMSKKVGLSRPTIYRKMRRGEFPAAIDLGNGQLGWLEEEIDEWIASRPRRVPQGHGATKNELASEAAA